MMTPEMAQAMALVWKVAIGEAEGGKAKCSVCHSKHHITADHPAPITVGVCAYCFRNECYEGGPCNKAATACGCACLSRGSGG